MFYFELCNLLQVMTEMKHCPKWHRFRCDFHVIFNREFKKWQKHMRAVRSMYLYLQTNKHFYIPFVDGVKTDGVVAQCKLTPRRVKDLFCRHFNAEYSSKFYYPQFSQIWNKFQSINFLL